MIPRLQAFYGGPQDGWLSMPMALLRSYIVMLPRLRAERALQGVSETMIGTGSMEKKHAERALGDWEREANQGQRVNPALVLSEEDRRDLYAASGFFEVEVVEAKP